MQDRWCREVGVPDTSTPTAYHLPSDIYHLTCSILDIYHLPSDWMQDGWCRVQQLIRYRIRVQDGRCRQLAIFGYNLTDWIGCRVQDQDAERWEFLTPRYLPSDT